MQYSKRTSDQQLLLTKIRDRKKARADALANILVSPADLTRALATFGVDSTCAIGRIGGGLSFDILTRIKDTFLCRGKGSVAKVDIPSIPMDLLANIMERGGPKGVAMGKMVSKELRGRMPATQDNAFYAMHFGNSLCDIMMYEVRNVDRRLNNSMNRINLDVSIEHFQYLRIDIRTQYSGLGRVFQHVRFAFSPRTFNRPVVTDGDRALEKEFARVNARMPASGITTFDFSNVYLDSASKKTNLSRLKTNLNKFLLETVRVPSYAMLTNDICQGNCYIGYTNARERTNMFSRLKMFFLKTTLVQQQRQAVEEAMDKVRIYTGKTKPSVNTNGKSNYKQDNAANAANAANASSGPLEVQGAAIKMIPRQPMGFNIEFTAKEITLVESILALYIQDALTGDDYRLGCRDWLDRHDLQENDNPDDRKRIVLTIDHIYDKIMRNGYGYKRKLAAANILCIGDLSTFINQFENNTDVYKAVKSVLNSWPPVITPIRKYLTSIQLDAITTYLKVIFTRKHLNAREYVYSQVVKDVLVELAYFEQNDDDEDDEDGDEEERLVMDDYFFPNERNFIKRLYCLIDAETSANANASVSNATTPTWSLIVMMIDSMNADLPKLDLIEDLPQDEIQPQGEIQPQEGGKIKRFTKSLYTVLYKGKSRVVYTGVRGGWYIRIGKEFKSVKRMAASSNRK